MYVCMYVDMYVASICITGIGDEPTESFHSVAGATDTISNTSLSWCISNSGVDDSTLQAAMTYACGQSTADCTPIKLGAPCFLPNTVAFHSSYVFNSYYQMHAKASGTCNFQGAAIVTTQNPSKFEWQYTTHYPL